MRDFPRRSIISATVTSLRVEEEERLVSEERSDEFQVFPETRRRAEKMRSGYVATKGKSPEILLTNFPKSDIKRKALVCLTLDGSGIPGMVTKESKRNLPSIGALDDPLVPPKASWRKS